MKHLKTVVILLVLFGLPAGSWYFLKFGSNWRKDKLASLEIKANFVNSYNFDVDSKTALFAQLSYRTTVIDFGGSLNERENKLIDQYRKSPTFQWMTFVKDSSQLIELSSKDPKKFFVYNSFQTDNENLDGAKYMLLDTSINIRQVYFKEDESTLNKLIEDIAIVLPRSVEKDISIRKNKND